MKLHKSITPERIMDACQRRDVSLDNPGFCTACGADARGYECEECGAHAVYGAEELLLEVVA